MGFPVNGELVDAKVMGAVIFGPKLWLFKKRNGQMQKPY